MYQDIIAPRPGLQTYRLSLYAAASNTAAPKTDGRVGANASGTVSLPVVADGTYHQQRETVKRTSHKLGVEDDATSDHVRHAAVMKANRTTKAFSKANKT